MKKLLLLITLFITTTLGYAQTKDVELGSGNLFRQTQGANFDYSDPEAINIKVAVWGFVRYPGRYTVPVYTSVSDLLSYAGGPTDDAKLEDLRIYRVDENKNRSLINFNYNDLLWEKELTATKENVPALQASDVLLVPGSQRLYFRDYFTLTLSVISTLVSVSILILNIAR